MATVNREVGRLGQPRYLVMGMDPGVASCGFALLDLNNQEILEMGSRLFDSPVHPKSGQSLAVIRRGFRSTRRNLDRTQMRLKHCLDLLKRYGVVPQNATREYFHTAKGDRQPLLLRVEGLDRVLTPREWSLVLYSLCKRRGYIPHGEGSLDKSSEGGKVLAALSSNEELIAAHRTVGEWLSSLPQSRNRGGNYDKCVTHAQIIEEVHVLFDCQRRFGSEYASVALENEYIDVCDWEKPRDDFDKRTYDAVGHCVYFPEEKRAARCTLTSEMVAAYAALGNITIMEGSREVRHLTADERDACMGILFSVDPIKGNKDCSVKYGMLRKMLDLPSCQYFKGVSTEEERSREVYKPKGWRTLRSVLHEKSRELICGLRENRDLADAVMEAVAYASSQPVLEQKLSELPLDDAEIASLCAMPYSSKAMNGYGNRSKRALDMLFDCFEDPSVLTLTDAEEASGLGAYRMQESQIVRSARLMPYESWLAATGRTNNNPVVKRSMAQMRKVVNAVCRKWGVPDEIHVELDRELKLPKRAKDQIAKANKRNEKENKRIAGEIAELLGVSENEVGGKAIEKYRLWEEQGCFDLYDGSSIEVERLVSDDTYTQIDHILPFSRTGDNSRHNKVLVLAHNNQRKREQTPYEWMTSGAQGAPSWEDFEARVEANQKLSRKKKSFLLERDLASKEGQFQSKNMVDTAYMSREVCAYLSDCLEFPEDGLKAHVVPVAGRATAWLRRKWGLNFGSQGEKDRSDDRHHATDACVIAACSRSIVIKTARIMQETHWSVTPHMNSDERAHARTEKLGDVLPWKSFVKDVKNRREDVVPTRFTPRKGKGELFEQTIYSYIGENASGKSLARKSDSQKDIVMGNGVVSDDGKSIVKVSEMLCLRLWHDPDAKGRGGAKGCWYADPVYKADIPALKAGTYVPKIARAHTGRKMWKPVPDHVLQGTPLEIYLGDVVRIGERKGRFAGFNIANAKWQFNDMLTKEQLKGVPTVAQLNNELVPHVVRENIL